jgi:hypothetical protein
MTAHFLHYSALANNLTSKLTESDGVEIISGHYPAYVQSTMSSEGLRTIRDALNLLNKLESLEADGGGKSNLGSSAQNRLTHVTRTLNHTRTKVTRPDKDFRT